WKQGQTHSKQSLKSVVFQSRSSARATRDRANVLCRPGGPSGGIPPDPIPNSAVKASSAYGTASQDAGESVAARSAKNVCAKSRHYKLAKAPREKSRGAFVLSALR